MEDSTDNPIAVKVEGHSQSVILTYFTGDINSMVDAHFSRALRQVCKAKAPAAKTKKIRKSVKLEDSSSCQGRAAGAYTEPQVPPVAGRLLSDDAPGTWHSFPARTGGEGPVFPSITYSLSPEGLSLTGQQYATSLLHLLHSDRSEMGSGVASSMASSVASTSKPELLSSWTVPQGFRDAVDPAVSFEPGHRLEKKDLYWY